MSCIPYRQVNLYLYCALQSTLFSTLSKRSLEKLFFPGRKIEINARARTPNKHVLLKLNNLVNAARCSLEIIRKHVSRKVISVTSYTFPNFQLVRMLYWVWKHQWIYNSLEQASLRANTVIYRSIEQMHSEWLFLVENQIFIQKTLPSAENSIHTRKIRWWPFNVTFHCRCLYIDRYWCWLWWRRKILI